MKNIIISLLIVCCIAFTLTGCEGLTPSVPDDGQDADDTALSYIKVLPEKLTMNIYQTQKFEVKGYNSEHKPVLLDSSKVEKWVSMYSCATCGIVWTISPTKESLYTNFSPHKAGHYTVHVKYGDKWANADVEAF